MPLFIISKSKFYFKIEKFFTILMMFEFFVVFRFFFFLKKIFRQFKLMMNFSSWCFSFSFVHKNLPHFFEMNEWFFSYSFPIHFRPRFSFFVVLVVRKQKKNLKKIYAKLNTFFNLILTFFFLLFLLWLQTSPSNQMNNKDVWKKLAKPA